MSPLLDISMNLSGDKAIREAIIISDLRLRYKTVSIIFTQPARPALPTPQILEMSPQKFCVSEDPTVLAVKMPGPEPFAKHRSY